MPIPFEEPTTIIKYKCNICNKIYNISGKAEYCEQRHVQATCPHPDWYYYSGNNIGDIVVIKRRCMACIKEEVLLTNNQERLAEIWAMLARILC